VDALTTFSTVDLRVGTVLAAQPLANVRKQAYQVSIDFGEPIGVKRSAAQITDLYEPEALIGRQVVAVVNLPAKRIGAFTSEVLILGVADEGQRVVLLVPERAVSNGVKVF